MTHHNLSTTHALNIDYGHLIIKKRQIKCKAAER